MERTWGKAAATGVGRTVAGRVGHPKFVCGGTTEEQDKPCNPQFHCGEIKPQKPLTKKLVGIEVAEKLPSSQESSMETSTGS